VFLGRAGPTISVSFYIWLNSMCRCLYVLSMWLGTWFTHEMWASMNWVRYLAEEGAAKAYVAASVSVLGLLALYCFKM